MARQVLLLLPPNPHGSDRVDGQIKNCYNKTVLDDEEILFCFLQGFTFTGYISL